METIKDLQDKLNLVLWVSRNLGKLCEVPGYSEEDDEDEEVLRMGRITGYNIQGNACVVIVEVFMNTKGWKTIDDEDVIIIPPFASSSYSYQVMNEINIIV